MEADKRELREIAKSLLALAEWSDAPSKITFGDGMMLADVALSKNETMTVYVHKDSLLG